MSPLSHSDPNSLAAAKSVERSSVVQRQRVLNFIRAGDPVASWQIEEALHLSGNSVRPRIVELMEEGRIERCGHNYTRSGRKAHLYRFAQRPPVLLQDRLFEAPELVVP